MKDWNVAIWKIVKYLTLLIIIPLLAVALIYHSSLDVAVVSLTISIILVASWITYLFSPKLSDAGDRTFRHRVILQVSQFAILLITIFIALSSPPGELSLWFFVLVISFYLLLFFEAFYFEPRLSAFLFKLLVMQFIFIEAWTYGFTSVIQSDSYRDYYIAALIIDRGGGLPYPFTSLIWYNFSPMVPISSAISHLVTGVPLLQAEMILGFVLSCVSLLAVGAIAQRVFSELRMTMISMWIASLVPYFWLYSTYAAFPELLALAMMLLTFALVLGKLSLRTSIASFVLVLAIVLTHGGLALEEIGIMFLIFLMTKNKLALRLGIFASLTFITYSIFAAVAGVSSGLVSILQFLPGVITPVSLNLAPVGISAVSTYVELFKIVTYNYWYIFLGILSWVAIVELIRHKTGNSKSYLSLVIIGFVLFSFGSAIILFPVSQGQATRYVSLVSFLVLCVPSAAAIAEFRSRVHGKYLVIPLIIMMVVASVSYEWVSPIFWQDLGNNSYSADRFIVAITQPEDISQSYINEFDHCYPVAGSFPPYLVNLTASCPGVTSYQFLGTLGSTVGVIGNPGTSSGLIKYPKLGTPYLALLSTRIQKLNVSTVYSDPYSFFPLTNSEIVYSNGISYIGLL